MLERIQNEAARIVTGATKIVSINSLIQETGWELSQIIGKSINFSCFIKQHHMSPDYLSSLIPATIGSTTNYQLQNSSLLTLHASFQLDFNSFLPSVMREWNELPEVTRDLPSIAAF